MTPQELQTAVNEHNNCHGVFYKCDDLVCPLSKLANGNLERLLLAAQAVKHSVECAFSTGECECDGRDLQAALAAVLGGKP